ncbi:unnamed protein product [Danaus chrysippus]|uniref:(African queen) hypothetical protein n=1 Tax=Danaus chrysippus TaxID=151541 RepID=A0A8J2QHW5_9NEOP|nr:unnamed protein product [Danaus chrysippus]
MKRSESVDYNIRRAHASGNTGTGSRAREPDPPSDLVRRTCLFKLHKASLLLPIIYTPVSIPWCLQSIYPLFCLSSSLSPTLAAADVY